MLSWGKISPYTQDLIIRYAISSLVLIYFVLYLPFIPNTFENNEFKFGLLFVNFVGDRRNTWRYKVKQICGKNGKAYLKYLSCDQAYVPYIAGAVLAFIVVKAAIINLINCVYLGTQPHPEVNPREYMMLNRRCSKISMACAILPLVSWMSYIVVVKLYARSFLFTNNLYFTLFVLVLFLCIVIPFNRDYEIVESLITYEKLQWENAEEAQTTWAKDENQGFNIPTPQQLMKWTQMK